MTQRHDDATGRRQSARRGVQRSSRLCRGDGSVVGGTEAVGPASPEPRRETGPSARSPQPRSSMRPFVSLTRAAAVTALLLCAVPAAFAQSLRQRCLRFPGLARRLQAGSRRPGHLPAGRLRSARRRLLRPQHDPARSRAGRVPPDLRAVLEPHGAAARQEGRQHGPAICRPAPAHREPVRRPGSRAGGDLGPRDRLRLVHRKVRHDPVAGDAGLRLPPRRQVPRRAPRRPAHRAARRPEPRHHAGRLGGRDRPDPVHALLLPEICGGLRRQGPPGPAPQRARRPGLHGRSTCRPMGGRPGRAGRRASRTSP